MQTLNSSLKTLHSLRIVHGDIKPNNVMWSPAYEKLVFVDYGLSRCVKEPLGQKSRVSYFGTFQFSSAEMLALFDQNCAGFVDLYYNDIHAMKVMKSCWTSEHLLTDNSCESQF